MNEYIQEMEEFYVAPGREEQRFFGFRYYSRVDLCRLDEFLSCVRVGVCGDTNRMYADGPYNSVCICSPLPLPAADDDQIVPAHWADYISVIIAIIIGCLNPLALNFSCGNYKFATEQLMGVYSLYASRPRQLECGGYPADVMDVVASYLRPEDRFAAYIIGIFFDEDDDFIWSVAVAAAIARDDLNRRDPLQPASRMV